MTIAEDILRLREFMREAQRQLGSEVDHSRTNAAFERVVQKALGRRENKTSVAGTNYIVHIAFDKDVTYCSRARSDVNCIEGHEVGRFSGNTEDGICRACVRRARSNTSVRP